MWNNIIKPADIMHLATYQSGSIFLSMTIAVVAPQLHTARPQIRRTSRQLPASQRSNHGLNVKQQIRKQMMGFEVIQTFPYLSVHQHQSTKSFHSYPLFSIPGITLSGQSMQEHCQSTGVISHDFKATAIPITVSKDHPSWLYPQRLPIHPKLCKKTLPNACNDGLRLRSQSPKVQQLERTTNDPAL